MKKDRCRKIWMVGLLCGAIVFGLACQTGLAGDVVRIAAGEWAPYLGPDLPHSGIAGRIIKDAFSKSHIKVEFKFYPWKRAFQLAEKGAFDGTAIWFKNSEREKSFYYSDAVIVEKFVIFHLKAQPFTWRTFEDLHGKILGGLLGFSYGEEMDRAIRSKIVNMERTSSDVQNFKKLLIGRIHLYPQEVKVGCQVLETQFLPGERAQITHHAKHFLEQPTYLLLTKQHARNKDLIEIFNIGLNELKAQGKIE